MRGSRWNEGGEGMVDGKWVGGEMWRGESEGTSKIKRGRMSRKNWGYKYIDSSTEETGKGEKEASE